MLEKISVTLFDFLKKRNMEKEYEREDIWGRSGGTKDIEAAVAMIRDKRYDTCLDVGTGLGHYAELVAPLCSEILAIDIAKLSIKRTSERLKGIKNITFKVANIRGLDSERKFNLVILGDVLYYLGDTRFPEEFKKTIRDISNLVAANGRILMSNYISSARNEEQLREYTKLFELYGMTTEKTQIFSNDSKSWLITVLSQKIV